MRLRGAPFPSPAYGPQAPGLCLICLACESAAALVFYWSWLPPSRDSDPTVGLCPPSRFPSCEFLLVRNAVRRRRAYWSVGEGLEPAWAPGCWLPGGGNSLIFLGGEEIPEGAGRVSKTRAFLLHTVTRGAANEHFLTWVPSMYFSSLPTLHYPASQTSLGLVTSWHSLGSWFCKEACKIMVVSQEKAVAS